MEKRRTNASFLSDEEAARESKRTEDFVRSIAGNKSTTFKLDRKKQMPKEQQSTCSAENSTATVGESEKFEIDFDRQNKIISIYEKADPTESQPKLKIRMSETKDFICTLEKAKTIISSQEVQTIGEGKTFTVDYDSIHGLVMIFKKENSKIQYKLAFTQTEIPAIIDLLIKARSLL